MTSRTVFYASCLLDLPLGIAIYLLGAQVLTLALAILMLALLSAQCFWFIRQNSPLNIVGSTQ